MATIKLTRRGRKRWNGWKLWILPKTGTNTTVELGAFTAFALTAGDFNEDGFPDLAVGMIGAGGPVILLNDGTGHFAGSTALTTGSNPLTLIVKDFNEDGHADLAVGHRDQSVRFDRARQRQRQLRAGCELRHRRRTSDPGRRGPQWRRPSRFVVVDKVNAADQVSRLTTMTGDGHGALGAAVIQRTAVTVHTAALAGINGDGNVDLIRPRSSRRPSSSNSGTVSATSGRRSGTGAPIFSQVAVDDFNGDGRPDVAIGDEVGVVRVFPNSCGGVLIDCRSPRPIRRIPWRRETSSPIRRPSGT